MKDKKRTIRDNLIIQLFNNIENDPEWNKLWKAIKEHEDKEVNNEK